MEYENFLDLVKKRRSHWEFKSDPVPDEYIEKIVDAARYAPSGFNSQPWEFVVIKDQELQEEITKIIAENMFQGGSPPKPAPGRKDPLGFKTAPVYIPLFGDNRLRTFGPPGAAMEESRWSDILQSSLSIPYQYMCLAATCLGLGTRWVSPVAFPPVNSLIKGLLGVPEEFKAFDMLALGYSDFTPHPKKMRDLKEVLHYGKCTARDFRTEEQIKDYFKR